MGIQDRDYMRRPTTRWDERRGEMRLEPEEPRRTAHDGAPSRSRTWVLAGAAVLAVVLAGGWWYKRSREEAPARASVGQRPVAATHRPEAPGAGDCLIKGNVNSHGDRIYHVPGSANYERTVIDESKGEQWFCTEAEARAAGWRAPRG